MIKIASSEKRTKTQHVKLGSYADWIEEATGADMIVSPLETPLNHGTLLMHMANGACLLQIKHEGDLIESVGDRLNASISKMIPISRYAWQRQLVPVGMYHQGNSPHCKTQVSVDSGRKPYWRDSRKPVNWRVTQVASWHWILRGGVFVPFVHNHRQLEAYARRLELDLKELNKKKKTVYPELPVMYSDPRADDPLQEVEVIHDGRRLLTAFPGIGATRAQDLWKITDGQLWHALLLLSEPWNKKRSAKKLPKGIGKRTVEEARILLGLIGDHADFQLALELISEMYKKGKNE